MKIVIKPEKYVGLIIRRKDSADISLDFGGGTWLEFNNDNIKIYLGLDEDPMVSIDLDESVQLIDFY